MAGTLTLPHRLDLTAARRLTRDLRDRSGAPLVIDASAVSHLGGLCLQVLLAAAQDWGRRGVSLRLAPQSPAFVEALTQFGVGPDALENGAK
ncbi:STAS domain-containing protein [Paracoccus suum]|uniref:STAS domain-containing protein n=1 Tax=Paracoccus suum TaxID=2259340 RepID=A0A344PMU9_9RHOB|nr:STAS domain-containing protein [Paracoccus suum]AXC50704.1 STAS domain-containing protein [Paracoccus suum]